MTECSNCGRTIRKKMEPEGFFCTMKCGYLFAVKRLRLNDQRSRMREAERKIESSKTRH